MREVDKLVGFIVERSFEAPSDAALCRRPGPTEALDAADAARLRAKMAARYHDWTGRDLAADLALAEQEARDA